MFRSRVLSTIAVSAAMLTVAGTLTAAACPGGNNGDHGKTLPAHIFAPYFEAYTADNPATLSQASGAKYLTLAFLQTPSDSAGNPIPGSCDISWNGTAPVAQSTYGADIAKIRAHGGDVIPSFGGYSADDTATEIADSCTSVDKIAAAYEKVVTTYNVTRLDMDVEDNSLTDLAGIDRRNKAIKQVEDWAAKNHRTVQFVYTIPTNVSGLDSTGYYVLQNAVTNGARIDIVNIMTFDYYDGATHEMGADSETAAGHLIVSLHKLYPHKSTSDLWKMVGVTEMPGKDDYGSGGEAAPFETTTIADAKNIEAWAKSKNLAEVSFWAVERDQQTAADCTIGTFGGDDCSGIAQTTWEFSHIFEPFTSGYGGGNGWNPHRH